jgi:hypothetical protein
MVFLKGFVVEILPAHGDVDKFTRNGAKYVGLDRNSEYRIKLVNGTNRRCDVAVELEGESIGRWRIDAHDDLIIERPVDRARKFTFLSEMSMEAIDAGVIPGDSSNGLVVATFYPEKERVYEAMAASPRGLRTSAAPSSAAPSSSLSSNAPASLMARSSPAYESGATVLGDHSHQKFGQVRALRDDEIDWNNITKIQLRLVVRKLHPVPSPVPRPYPIHSTHRTPYPGRIDESSPRYTRV